MTLRNVFALTLALGTSAGAFAQSTEATPSYRYGMDLDIAEVIRLEPSATTQGHSSTATMTYRDTSGQVRSVRYYLPDTTQANQN
ncbi:DUF2790 domain-containing protein [Pseudomonas sp. NPDC090233]|uniref:DUF2790 domain-containing protein n=1 Tax=Pseudomonas sp. NPDC090233 TaxID=3364479 RepID=UPI00383A48AA